MFFTELYALMQDGQALNLNLLRRDGRLYVCLLPKVTDMPQAATRLVPLNIDGTPAELDAGFLEAVSRPVAERLGLLSNVEAFRESTASALKKKDQPQTATSGSAATKEPGKTEKQMDQARMHEQSGRLVEAYSIYKKLSAAAPQDAKLKEKAAELWNRMSQRSFFGDGKETMPEATAQTRQTGMPAMPTQEDASLTGEDTDYDADTEDDHASGYGYQQDTAPAGMSDGYPHENGTAREDAICHPQPQEEPEDMFARLVHMAGTMS